jgi:hypothetical protein
VTVEPEKAETSANERGADDGQLPRKRIKRDLQVFRDAEIASRIRKQSVSKCHRDGATDCETIQPVSEVDRVRSAHNDEREKHERKPTHVGDDGRFDKRHVKRTRLNLEQWTA